MAIHGHLPAQPVQARASARVGQQEKCKGCLWHPYVKGNAFRFPEIRKATE
jgi:hypothetical protein